MPTLGKRPPPGGTAAALSYLVIMFLFNELRLALVLRWAPHRRQRVERFMSIQGRRMLATVHRLCGLRYSFDTGAASLPCRFLLVTNHQSLADILMLVAAFPRHPLKFVAKRSLQRGIPPSPSACATAATPSSTAPERCVAPDVPWSS